MAAINNNEILNNVLQELRGVRVPDRRHASRGGRAYPKEVRELVIQMILNAERGDCCCQNTTDKYSPCTKEVSVSQDLQELATTTPYSWECPTTPSDW